MQAASGERTWKGSKHFIAGEAINVLGENLDDGSHAVMAAFQFSQRGRDFSICSQMSWRSPTKVRMIAMLICTALG